MDKYQNKYRIKSSRLQGYDYGSNGMYFITICTKNRIHYFGEIVPPNIVNPDDVETDNYPSLRMTKIGEMACDFWSEIPKHYPFVGLDAFVIMPNHIHGILFFNNVETDNYPSPHNWSPNKFGPQSKNLGAVIRAFKSSTKRFTNLNGIEFEWQSRFHDIIIRDEQSLNNMRRYIVNNPAKWAEDEHNKNVIT